jgi:hypothetical protein
VTGGETPGRGLLTRVHPRGVSNPHIHSRRAAILEAAATLVESYEAAAAERETGGEGEGDEGRAEYR